MAFAKELGSILSGGLPHLSPLRYSRSYGHWWPIAIYFAFMAAIGLVTTFFAPETRGRISTYPRMQFKAREREMRVLTKDFWVITPYAVWKNHSERKIR